MADQTDRHDRHEIELVAAHAAGEATGWELQRAQELIDRCDRCLELARDLRSIALGLQSLPNAERVAASVAAPRDFRISPSQAERLRPAAPVARWSARLWVAIASFGRPLGASMATLGIVGFLLGALSFGLGAPASMSLEMASEGTASGAGGAALGENPVAPAPDASKDASLTAVGPAPTDNQRETGITSDDAGARSRDASGASVWLFGGSTVLLIVGIGLLVIAIRGRTRNSGE